MKSVSNQIYEFTDVYRWLSREFTTVECTRTCE
nr:MAG TPA: Mitochondrial degradasome RNA helicase subunit C terminal [Caudoviricetes sp.]